MYAFPLSVFVMVGIPNTAKTLNNLDMTWIDVSPDNGTAHIMEENVSMVTGTGQFLVYELHPSAKYGWNPKPEEWHQGNFVLYVGDDR